MVKQWYFYGVRRRLLAVLHEVLQLFPLTGQIYFNGHEYAKQQCLKQRITFAPLDNAFGTVSDPAAVQRICGGLDDRKIYQFADKSLARLPQPFTPDDEDADYQRRQSPTSPPKPHSASRHDPSPWASHVRHQS
jgi:hypothetical protein